MTDEQVIPVLTNDEIQGFLDLLYNLKDKGTQYQYVAVSPALDTAIRDFIFKTDKYKARLESISGMVYSVSHLRLNPSVPQYVLAPIDVAKIVAVYTDFEGNQITINDLFNSKLGEWTNPTTA